MIHDGELGAPSRTINGETPWAENTADVPPLVTGTEFAFFTPVELTLVNALVARLIPTTIWARAPSKRTFRSSSTGSCRGRTGAAITITSGDLGEGRSRAGLPEPLQPGAVLPGRHRRHRPIGREDFAGVVFAKLSAADQDHVLKGLEGGDVELDGGVDAKSFFTMLLQNTKEGYFSDPIYGGNKDMGAWKMIGFPGAHYDYKEWVSRHSERVPFDPAGLLGRPGNWDKG